MFAADRVGDIDLLMRTQSSESVALLLLGLLCAHKAQRVGANLLIACLRANRLESL